MPTETPTVTEKRCPTCNETKPASGFWRNRSRADGLQALCRVCMYEQHRRHRGSVARRAHGRLRPAAIPADAACSCGKRGLLRCGFPREEATCGQLLCPACANEIRTDLHYCPTHYERAQDALNRRRYGR